MTADCSHKAEWRVCLSVFEDYTRCLQLLFHQDTEKNHNIKSLRGIMKEEAAKLVYDRRAGDLKQ